MNKSMLITFVSLLAVTMGGAGANAGTRWALLIGVDSYEQPAFKRLSYCAKDATGLRDVLVRRAGYPKEQVVVLHDRSADPAMQPSRANILRTLREFLGRPQPEDLVVVSFSGHGTFVEPASYLCPSDADPHRPVGTMLRVDELYATIGRDCRAGHKALLIDACRSLSREGRGLAVDATATRFAEGLRNVPRGVWVLFSCTPGQASYENERLGHGVFMHYVIEGLSGLADQRLPGYSGGNRDGHVQSFELFNYANENCKAFVAGHHHAQQTPEVTCLDNVDLVLAEPLTDRPKRITDSLGMELALVPRGEFLMGSPDSQGRGQEHENERPQHRVVLSQDFYLGLTEVTQAQYLAVMGVNPSYFSAAGGGRARVAGRDTAACPVESVGYAEACEFCRRLAQRENLPEGTYRLPTEAEWEYAARAGSTEEFGPAGNGLALDAFAWFDDTAEGRPHPVGRLAANRLGLLDMHGNVAEWCSDWYHPGYYAQSPAEDPAGPAEPDPKAWRLLRGGCWCFSRDLCRVADRYALPETDRVNYAGFRVLRLAR